MKQNTLTTVIVAIIALTLMASSCKKPEKTPEDHLTGAKNGWILESATLDRQYTLQTGKDKGKKINDLTQGYLEDCEKQFVIKFTSDHGEKILPGKDLCDDVGAITKETASTWTYTKADDGKETLKFRVPFSINDQDIFDLLSTSEKEFKCRVNWEFVSDTTSAKSNIMPRFKIAKADANSDNVFNVILTYKAK